MPRDPDRTQTRLSEHPTNTFDPLDRGLAAAFGADHTPGGWSQPPLLRDDPSEHSPIVQTTSPEMPRGTDDRYQLLGEIARGGMGVILKGRDPNLGRDLAFKVLKAELVGKPGAVQRFVEEAQVGGQLQHPGIVPLHELGRFADGRPFFAMKLVKGRTLADLLAERVAGPQGGPLAPRAGSEPLAERADHPIPASRGRFLQFFQKVCETVAYAHSKGVIHRDLKPANVMVGGFGEVLVMDWGLAKVLPRGGIADELKASLTSRGVHPRGLDEEPTEIKTARLGSGSETAAGSVMGTPSYMPPEQAGGELDKVDERADVFGLGAILCVVLTGEPPYRGDSAEAVRLLAVRGQLADAFARLDSCGADAELVALCKRCLCPEREGRPRDAGELAAAVGAYLAGVEQRAHDAELDRAAAEARAEEEANTRRVALEKVAEERKRRKVQAALGLTFTALVALGGAFAWWQDKQAAVQRERLARNAEATTALLGRCEEALRADDAAKAAVALEAAEKRATEGGADELTDRLARCRADLAVARELDAVDQFRWTPVEGKFPDGPAMAERYRAVFGRFGADPGVVPPEEAARRVTGSVVRDRLVAALDRWLGAGRPAGVRTVLRAVDPDPFRDAVRDAVLADDGAKVADLAGRPEALDQPPGFVAALGVKWAIPAERRRELLTAALHRRPGNLDLLMTLGRTYPMNQKDGAEERVRWYQAAFAAHPRNGAARNSLGFALAAKGDMVEAIAYWREVIRLDPLHTAAHINLGAILHNAKRDYAGAEACFREALRLDPQNALAHHNLGIVLNDQGNPDGAITEYREALRLDPTSTRAHHSLGLALRRKGAVDEAIACYRKAIRLDPNHALTHNNLAWLLATAPDDRLRNGPEAVKLATRACELTEWKNASFVNTLAAAYAEAGDFDKAVEYQQKAMADPAIMKQYGPVAREQLDLYRQQKPYREPTLAPPPREKE